MCWPVLEGAKASGAATRRCPATAAAAAAALGPRRHSCRQPARPQATVGVAEPGRRGTAAGALRATSLQGERHLQDDVPDEPIEDLFGVDRAVHLQDAATREHRWATTSPVPVRDEADLIHCCDSERSLVQLQAKLTARGLVEIHGERPSAHVRDGLGHVGPTGSRCDLDLGGRCEAIHDACLQRLRLHSKVHLALQLHDLHAHLVDGTGLLLEVLLLPLHQQPQLRNLLREASDLRA
mmetsp:Transcript_110357/g.335529  ORF Transcript_110357/g.335529 Transcript_110357/m.335529 type:complete len:238 (-) Transcript_110357:373-1086(-)